MRDHSGCVRAVLVPLFSRSVLAVRKLIFLMTALEEGFKTTKKEKQTNITDIIFLLQTL